MNELVIAAALFGACIASVFWIAWPVFKQTYKNWRRRQKRRARKKDTLLGP